MRQPCIRASVADIHSLAGSFDGCSLCCLHASASACVSDPVILAILQDFASKVAHDLPCFEVLEHSHKSRLGHGRLRFLMRDRRDGSLGVVFRGTKDLKDVFDDILLVEGHVRMDAKPLRDHLPCRFPLRFEL